MISSCSFPFGGHISVEKIPGVLWLQVPVAERACKVWAPEHKPSRILQRHSHDLWCFHLSNLFDKLGICAWTDGLMDFDPKTHAGGRVKMKHEMIPGSRCVFWKILFERRVWNCGEVTSCILSRANRVKAGSAEMRHFLSIFGLCLLSLGFFRSFNMSIIAMLYNAIYFTGNCMWKGPYPNYRLHKGTRITQTAWDGDGERPTEMISINKQKIKYKLYFYLQLIHI